MEAIATLIVILIGLVGFGTAAMWLGEDTRDWIGDQHLGSPIH
jgi:hypothetical protein